MNKQLNMPQGYLKMMPFFQDYRANTKTRLQPTHFCNLSRLNLQIIFIWKKHPGGSNVNAEETRWCNISLFPRLRWVIWVSLSQPTPSPPHHSPVYKMRVIITSPSPSTTPCLRLPLSMARSWWAAGPVSSEDRWPPGLTGVLNLRPDCPNSLSLRVKRTYLTLTAHLGALLSYYGL